MLHTPYVCVCVYALCFLSSPPRQCWGVRKGLEAVVEWLPGIFQPPNPPFPTFFSSLYPRGVRTSAKKKKKRRQDSSRTWYNATSWAISTLSRCLVCLWIQTSAKRFQRVARDWSFFVKRWSWQLVIDFCGFLSTFFFFWIHILEKNSRIWMTCLNVKFSRFLKKVILRAILSIFTCEKWYLESDSWKFLKKQSQGYLIILRQWLSTSLVSKKEKK